jgi:hypothetical protein
MHVTVVNASMINSSEAFSCVGASGWLIIYCHSQDRGMAIKTTAAHCKESKHRNIDSSGKIKQVLKESWARLQITRIS